ncbi:MAG: 3'-5' exonuclease [Candidatus Dormibacteria bacterium]
MILLSIDFETSGLNKESDRVTEVGAVLWSTTYSRAMETASYFVKTDIVIPKEVTDLTGINSAMLKKFGYEDRDAFDDLVSMAEQADAFIGQNVIQFDKIFFENWAKRYGQKIPEKLWIDIRTDLPGVESKSLSYMAADAGFLNPFPHNAVADCLTVLRLVAKHNIDDVVARAKQPNIVIRAHQERSRNADAKKAKFLWKPELKAWLKVIKFGDLEEFAKTAPFDISVQKEITPEQVWYS